MEKEHKLFELKIEGEKITGSFDFNQDGDKVIDVVCHNKEAIEEIVGGITKLVQKIFKK